MTPRPPLHVPMGGPYFAALTAACSPQVGGFAAGAAEQIRWYILPWRKRLSGR